MYNWTVIFLVSCDNAGDQLQALKTMLEQILACTISQQVAVVFCINMPVETVPLIDNTYVPPATLSDAKTTLFYRIELNQAGVGPKSQLVKIKEDPNFCLVKKGDVQRYFQEVVIGGGYEADRYLLFTWGHGAAAGLYYNNQQDNTGRWNMLFIDDLRDAILGAFQSGGVQKLKLAIMMNCYMQFFDAGYALSLAGVEYLVSSEYGADFFGYNYAKIFDTLYAQPGDATPEILARLAVSSLGEDRKLRRQLFFGAFFVSDLGLYDKLGVAINTLGRQLNLEMAKQGQSAKIGAAVKGCWPYINSTYCLVDFFRFVRGIRRRLGRDWEKELIEELLGFQRVLKETHYYGWLMRLLPLATGFSVNIPLRRNNAFFGRFTCPRSTFVTSFCHHSDWAEFVASYSKYLGSTNCSAA